MGANRGAIDAVVAAVRHDLRQRDRDSLPDPGLAPAPESPVDRIPVAVFGRNITPGRSAAKPPKYPVDDRTVLLWASTAPPVRRVNRQQALQNTPFRFAQIAPAQACLQKAALNQPARAASTNSSTPPRSGTGRRSLAGKLHSQGTSAIDEALPCGLLLAIMVKRTMRGASTERS